MLTVYLTNAAGLPVNGREYWESKFDSILKIMIDLESQGFEWIMGCEHADTLEIAYWRLAQVIVKTKRAVRQGKRVNFMGRVYGGESELRELHRQIVEKYNDYVVVHHAIEEDVEFLTISDGRNSLPYNRSG